MGRYEEGHDRAGALNLPVTAAFLDTPSPAGYQFTFPKVHSASRIGFLEFALEPNGFLLISNLADLIGQASASADLRNVQLKFQVISGEGAIIPFTSSVDNGTADQVFRSRSWEESGADKKGQQKAFCIHAGMTNHLRRTE